MPQDASLSILGSSIMGELDAALKSGSEARRIDMLARITDVFIADAPRYSEEQVRFFDDLMVRLIELVDRAHARRSPSNLRRSATPLRQ